MRVNLRLSTLVVTLTLCSCQYVVDLNQSGVAAVDAGSLRANPRGGEGTPLLFRTPVGATALERHGHREVEVATSRGTTRAWIKDGIGMAQVAVCADDSGRVSFEGSGDFLLFNGDWAVYDSFSITSALWPESLLDVSNAVVYVGSEVTVAAGHHLRIGPASAIVLDALVNVLVHGEMTVEGSAERPVIFRSRERESPWGGILLMNRSGNARFDHTIFYQGGGNTTAPWVMGHSGSQPVLHVEGGAASITHCAFVFNPGKGMTSAHARVDIRSTLFAFCDMGGEFSASHVTIDRSLFCFFPDTSHDVPDDDNDALYFFETPGDGSDSIYSVVSNSTFYWGDDDAIDHNGAFLRIEHCWIERFFHEGVAASNKNRVVVYDTYITGCEQGIEAGYGAPHVVVDHCLVRGCVNGLRFGDDYTVGCEGFMEVHHSISVENVRNLFNLDLKTAQAVEGAVIVSRSVIDSDAAIGGIDVVRGPVVLTPHLLLAHGSNGRGIAAGGRDAGLVTPR